MSLEYSKFALKDYMEQRQSMMTAVWEEKQIAELAAELEPLLPPSALDELCGFIYKRFVLIPSSNIFLQNMADQFVLSCLLQDKPSSRYVFQYLLDAACENE